MHLLDRPFWDSRTDAHRVTRREKLLGYLIGPVGASMMNGVLGNYLNVYYTDVVPVAAIWGGLFLSLFPVFCKVIDAATYVAMGYIVDKTHSRQGKARPWLLLSVPILLAGMVMLYAVPSGSQTLQAAWIFLAYNLFYSVGYTAYSTSHTLLVPLSTPDGDERSRLSVFSNAQNMISGTFLAILFPCVLVPMMGTDRARWVTVITVLALVCCPLLLMEYFFTRERVAEPPKAKDKVDLRRQLACCLQSRMWKLVMLYVIVSNLCQSFYSTSVFYYCNWVLGSYNDGYTQALFYALGNAPLGLGVFLCAPVCRRLGRKKAMAGGYLLAACGCALCLAFARSLPMVLLGQCIKAIGTIPASFMTAALLADALDDVQRQSGQRCDGFSSSVFNIIVTVSAGIALCAFNLLLTRLGYQSPAAGPLPVQNSSVQSLFIFGALGMGLLSSLLLAGILCLMPGKVPAPKEGRKVRFAR